MSGPLPLRLCCMAAMAPALTEAATQAKIRLPETNAAASSDSVNRRNIRQLVHKEVQPEIASGKYKIVKTCGLVAPSPVSHLNGDSRQSIDKQPSVFPKLQDPFNAFKPITKLCKKTFQSEFLKAIRPPGRPTIEKVPQIMNQPSPGLDSEEGKCPGQIAQNGSHADTHSLNNTGRSAGGNIRRDSQQTGAHSGQLVPQARGDRNMCRKQGEGGRGVQSANSSSAGPSPGVCSTGRQVTTAASPGQLNLQVSSPDSNVDSERVDEDVQSGRAEAAKKQAQLERRIEFLLRRLRRAQGRQVEQHTRQQLYCYVEYQRQNLQTVAKTISNPTPASESSSDLKKELLSDDVKNLSTAALVSLVRRIQASNSSLQQQPQSIKPEVTSVLTMPDDARRESRVAAEKLGMNLSFMQSALDSDATESSSGGESWEEDGSEELPPPSTPLVRRAEWKWAYDRAAVASRWTWLQAQVSDLEYRIRQQSEIYRQARQAKGPVVLGEPVMPQDLLRVPSQLVRGSGDVRTAGAALVATVAGTEVSPCNVSALLSNVDKQASRLTQSLGNCLSPATTSPASSVGSSRPKSRVSSPLTAPNGLIDSPLSTASVDAEGSSPQGVSTDSRLPAESMDLSPVLDASCRAARCLPLKHPLRKRKLLRTSGLHLKSAKAAKLSSVKCHCQAPVTPCVLCSGRMNSVQAVDPDSMPFQERVALLDHSYHQVLSFQEEVPLSVHFEALLRSGEWQNKPQVRRPRAEYGHRRQKYLPTLIEGRKKPFTRKNATASVIIQSAKIRNKYDQKTGRKACPQRGKRLGKRALNAELKRRRNASFGAGLGLKRRSLKGMLDFQGNNFDTPAASPLSRDANMLSGNQKEKEVRKRRGESAYDINNIVIPHSMASLTRVEKLEYKEIPIPSWRDLTLETAQEETTLKAEVHDHKSNGLIAKKTPDEEEVEDLSDDTYILRHKFCETEEKKRFSNFVQYPPTRRNRTHSQISGHALDSNQQDLTRPATPSTPNQPVSMGTQASLDGGDFGGEDSMDMPGQRLGTSTPLTSGSSANLPHFYLGPTEDESAALSTSGGGVHGFGVPRRGSMSVSQRERLSLGSSMEDSEVDKVSSVPSVKPWTPRKFPLTDEEAKQLLVEEITPRDEKARCSLRVMPSISTLRPQPVEGSSQAGSSVSGSLPASPMPSSSSTSAVGDYDAADPEWVAEAESGKKGASQPKAIKR